ncbi:hypothetical protein NQ314_001711 [Rhamnusium bicolor]|uniref:BTB domain-containing protein n=1 Tax=Rhamnusium bicolor TaxID=1586634 RepID=A0AAV8ZTJ8_9CUCU|nr:hypothetical protein NQ314_001711 [Rhamnusium bicolor]
MLPQQYCLRWRYHHSNLQTMFSQLLEREAFCDVTLACEGRTIKAHKIVLSACSTYFETILSQYEEKDPILIMKDVKYVDIKCLVEFMYKGEINVEHVSTNSHYTFRNHTQRLCFVVIHVHADMHIYNFAVWLHNFH